MKKLLLMMLLFVAFSCTNDQLEKTNPIQNPENSTGSRAGGDGQFDLFGYGYDATGKYAHPNYAMHRVLDVDRLVADAPGMMNVNQSSSSTSKYFLGINSKKYIENLSISVEASGGWKMANEKLFSGSVKSSIDKKRTESEAYSFASYSMMAYYKKITTRATLSDLCNYLDPIFQSQLYSLTPDEIVRLYGTHVMTGVSLGVKVDFIYSSKANDSDKESTVKAGMTAGIEKVFSVKTDISHSQQLITKNYEQEMYYEIIGGMAHGTSKVLNLDQNPSSIDLSYWQSSVTMANIALVDFPENSLIPIYEFVTDPVKKAEIKSAVEKYIASKEIVYPEIPEPVIERVPIYCHTPKQAPLGGFNMYFCGNIINQVGVDLVVSDLAFYLPKQELPETKKLYRAAIMYRYKTSWSTNDYTNYILSLSQYISGTLYSDNYATFAGMLIGYIYTQQMPGTVPLYSYHYRLKNSSATTNLPNQSYYHDITYYYTTKKQLPSKSNYTGPLETIVGYVYPAN